MINKIKCELKQVDYIFHVADIHIRNWKRHKEYKEVFDKMFDELKTCPPNTIVTVGGDIVHAKTDMSPELIQMTNYFLNGLGNIAPTIVICGNHDTNLNNNHRLDALTPIIEAAKHPNVFYLRDTGVYGIGDIALSVMSLLDQPDEYKLASDITKPYKRKFALYHGTIMNSKTDTGMVLAHGLDQKYFKGYDAVLLGDIHKRQILNKKPYTFYPGSLVQQNFGESYEGHGYALLDVNKLECTFKDIPNQYAFLTVDVENGDLPDNLPITSKTNVRLRVKQTTPAQLKKVLASLRKTYKCSDVIVQHLDRISTTNDNQLFNDALSLTDIRNTQTQNNLLAEYLLFNNIDDELLQKVIAINNNLNASINQSEQVRNIEWKPKKFEFDNMFSYGEGNVVNFQGLDGTCGLFAPNHAGKSAILDALCFCLFDMSIRASRADQVVNNKKDNFWCKFNFELKGVDYFIEKTATRYTKGPLAGKMRVDIDFWYNNDAGEKVSLNGEQRRDTDKNIQSYVGTFNDFILTTLSLQNNNSSFIDKTQSERKELLANFLDLKTFDTLYELASKEIKTASVLLEEYQKQDFETKLGDAERVKETYSLKYEQEYANQEKTQLEIDNLTTQILDLSKKLRPCHAEKLNITQLQTQAQRVETEITSLSKSLGLAEERYKNVSASLSSTDTQLKQHKETFDNLLFQTYTQKLKDKSTLDAELSTLKVTIKSKLDKLKKLSEHKYDPNCQYCIDNVFVKDAMQTQKELEDDKETVNTFLTTLSEVEAFIMNNKHIEAQAEEVSKLIRDQRDYKNSFETVTSNCENLKANIQLQQNKLDAINADIELYNSSKSDLEHNKQINTTIVDIQSNIKVLQGTLKQITDNVKICHGKIQVAESTIRECNKSILHMQELAEKQTAYDYYLKAVSKDGIPYLLISKVIPHIQNYVNNILSQVVDFTMEIETDGKNINVYICYDGNKWPLELSSGMERFISSLAIRVALIKITNLPKPNFIAIDEGLGVLDSSNLNSMHAFFNHIKDLFKFSLVISHIDVVRDMVDNILTVDRKDDFSYIKC